MAKPQSAKQQNKASEVTETVETAPESPPKEDVTTPASNTPIASTAKKDSTRPKTQASAKNGSLLPSAYKLEQLKAAVTAAGNTEKLLLILHHVEEAGGKAEVTESIEAYRVLKTVLDE
jgi:hypothetical protein